MNGGGGGGGKVDDEDRLVVKYEVCVLDNHVSNPI